MLLCIRFGRVCLSSQATTFDLINDPFALNDFKCENDIAKRHSSNG